MRDEHVTTAPTLIDLLFEKAGVGLCLVAPDGTVVRANAEWFRSTGFTEEQVIGEDISGLFPATRDMALAMHARARAGHRVEVPRHAQFVSGRETWWEGSIEAVPMEGGAGLLITAREVASTATDQPADALQTALAALDAERRRFAAVLDALPAGVALADANGRITHFNAALQRIWGNPPVPQSAAEYREWRAWWVDGGEPLAAHEWAMARALATGEVVPGDLVEIERFDGSGRAIIINAAAPIRNAQGQIVGGALAEVDVTDQKRAEEALAAEREKYRALFEHSVDAVYLSTTDGTILDANLAACRLHGMTLDEIQRAGRGGLVVNDERHEAALKARAATGHVRAEMTVRRKDGSTVPVEVESVLIDPSRPDSEAFVISRDITERKRAEEELRANLARSQRTEVQLALALQSARIGTWEYDPVGHVATWSPLCRELLGVHREGPIPYEKFIEAVYPDDRDVANAAVARALDPAGPGWYAVEYRVTWPDGSLHWISALGRAWFEDRGGERVPMRMIGTVLEVTGQKEAEQALRDADRRKDEFLGMLSHELRNPLAPIRNSTYILRHAVPGSDQARRAQRVIERQTDHLTRLVDDLLDVTRIARGKVELRRERVDVADVARRAAEDQRSILHGGGIRLALDLPAEAVWADADPTRLAQVIGNLLHNSGKFTPAGGEVAVSVRARGATAELRVRDTGVGIEPGLLAHMFEPFVQSDRSLARTQGGLGLGLALVKGLVELHGGTVRASSAGAGQGAEFVLELPTVTQLPDESARYGATSWTVRGRRVLVVDDNHDAAETLAELIEMLGHRAEVAYDGPTALARIRASGPDVVLCDIGLPGMSGYELAKVVREGGSRAQLFAISGYAQPEDVRRAIAAGFDGHIAKPPKIEDVERLLA